MSDDTGDPVIDDPVATPAEGTDETEKAKVVDAIRMFHQRALDAKSRVEDGLAGWRDATWWLAQALRRGKQLCDGNTRAFHAWLTDNELGDDFINANDRAALLSIAANPDIAQRILKNTTRLSWQLIWRMEIQPTLCRSTKGRGRNGRAKASDANDDDDGSLTDDPPPRSPLNEVLAKNLSRIGRQLLEWSSQHVERDDLIWAAGWGRDELAALLEEDEEQPAPASAATEDTATDDEPF
jgi:hypothetical protein